MIYCDTHAIPDRYGKTKCDECGVEVYKNNSRHVKENQKAKWRLLCFMCHPILGLMELVGVK